MRILFLSREYPPQTGWGGIGTFVSTIAPALARSGHDVHVLSCVDGQQQSDYLNRGVSVHRRDLIRLPGLQRITQAPQFVSWLRTGLSTVVKSKSLGSFDAIDFPNNWAEGCAFGFLRKRYTVCTIHTLFQQFFVPTTSSTRRDLRWTNRLEQFTTEKAQVAVTSSSLMEQKLRALGWLRKREVVIIPRPVDWQRWEHVPEASKTPPTALFVGRIEPRKAPELLVEAVQMLRRELPNVKAVFAGGFRAGPDGRPQMFWANGKASILDGCDFLGHVADAEMEALLSKARVIVQPSALESFGLAAAEGMASGRPAIVTDTCGIADFIRQAAGGDVVPHGDPCALAAALKPYLCSPDLAKAVGTRAKNAVREQLDPDYIAARTEQLYERIHAA